MKETKKHTKHTALTRPLGGEYHNNEWGLIGAPCDLLTKMAGELSDLLSDQLKVGYIDADHKEAAKSDNFYSSLTDKISYQAFATNYRPEQKQHRKFFNELDLLFVNGNHFKANKQIVWINDRKKDSLQRKIDRLTDIRVIVMDTEENEIFDFVQDIIRDKKDIYLSAKDDIDGIAKIILKDYNNTLPPLHGLVFAGGKSQRMGEDKGAIKYHNKIQREHTADLLAKVCDQTYISCRKDQKSEIASAYKMLEDSFEGLGPYGGMLSAFRAHPNCAWLCLPCDLPYMDQDTLDQLVASRDRSKLATCFHNPNTKFPEPLITIWEPRAYPVLLEFLSQGYSCLRKVLINTDVKQIEMKDLKSMTNVNNKEEYLKVQKELSTSINFIAFIQNPIKLPAKGR